MDNKKIVDLIRRIAEDRDEGAFSQIFDFSSQNKCIFYKKWFTN